MIVAEPPGGGARALLAGNSVLIRLQLEHGYNTVLPGAAFGVAGWTVRLVIA